MIKVVLDSSVLISGILVKEGMPAQILEAFRENRIALLTSPPIIEEIRRALRYKRLVKRHGWGEEKIEEFLAELEGSSIQTQGELEVKEGSRDPTDDKYLACAVEGQADFIISGERGLLDMKSYQEIPIVTVRDFWEMFTPFATS